MTRRREPRRLIRWLVQFVFLAAFVVLFARTRYGLAVAWHDVFFRLDPLVLVISSLALRALVAAALLALVPAVLTLVFGRFFCGWVCPLGTVIDAADSLVPRRRRLAPAWKNGKYGTLIFLLVAAAAGASFLGFLDPLVITGRTLALVFYPALTRLAAAVGTVRAATFAETLIALVSFLAILGLGYFARRFWCRNLCPLGGLYALLAKLAPLKYAFRAECRQCGACSRACPTGAIDEAHHRIDPGECVLCDACVRACPDGVIGYGPAPRPARVDIGRREMVIALGTGLLAAPLARAAFHGRVQGRLIRPPGSLPEPEFLNACLRCGRCLKACPTNGLQPCVLEAGADGLWTPRLVPRIGGCEKHCNLCGRVCPTGAIRSLPLEEKTYAVMGKAVVDRSRCLAWEQDRQCLVCDEACPYDAIAAVSGPEGGRTLNPVVDEDVCIGCGLCEARCPVNGPAAIQVWSIGEERRRTGNYATPDKVRARRECGEARPAEELPAGFILDEN